MATNDPTREQMLEALAPMLAVLGTEADPSDVECALYWYANDWHGGIHSNLYSVLSMSDYRPGAIECGPEDDSIAAMLYVELEEHFNIANPKD